MNYRIVLIAILVSPLLVSTANHFGGTLLPSASANVSSTTITSTYKVTVSESGSTITATDSNGVGKYSGTNAASAIQASVNAVAFNGGGIVHINAGMYGINKAIVLSGINNLTIEGAGQTYTILQCTLAGSKLFVKAGATHTSYLTIKNLDLDGANISDKLLDFSNISFLMIDHVILERHNDPVPGVYLIDLTDATIQNSIMRNPNSSGDLISITGQRVHFQYNEVTRTGARGGGLTSGNLLDSWIVHNNFHDFRGYAAVSFENMNIASAPYSFKNIEIGYNTFNNLDGNAILSLGYSGPGQFYYLQIHGNTIQNAVGHGIMLNAFDTEPNVMTYNTNIVNNTLLYTAGMSLGPLSNCVINNNVIDHTANWRGYGIYLFPGSSYVSMSGNSIAYTAQSHYYYTGSIHISINGVTVA